MRGTVSYLAPDRALVNHLTHSHMLALQDGVRLLRLSKHCAAI